MFLVNIMLNRLNNNNGIIKHNSDGQDKSKQCQRVDRKTKGRKKRKCAYDRYWYGQDRNQGRPEILQE
jgi:hypothetical protein